jgi:hypothetical protein
MDSNNISAAISMPTTSHRRDRAMAAKIVATLTNRLWTYPVTLFLEPMGQRKRALWPGAASPSHESPQASDEPRVS